MRVCGQRDPEVERWEPAICSLAHSFHMASEVDDLMQEGRRAAVVSVRNNSAVLIAIRGAMRKWIRRRVDLVRIPEWDRRRGRERWPLVPIEIVDLAGIPDRAAFTPRTAVEDEALAAIAEATEE